MNYLKWLEGFYVYLCHNKSWSKESKVFISTLDNPGWTVEICLERSEFEGYQFDYFDRDFSDFDWILMRLSDNIIIDGSGDPFKLKMMIGMIRQWIDSYDMPLSYKEEIPPSRFDGDPLEWLQKYYFSCCDGDWEHYNGIHMETVQDQGWKISIDLQDTYFDEIPFDPIEHKRSETDWISCERKGATFIAQCGPYNLEEVIHIFRTWVDSHDYDYIPEVYED